MASRLRPRLTCWATTFWLLPGLLCLPGLLGLLPAAAQAPVAVPGAPFWTWQAPRPSGYALRAVHVFDDQSAIAVGDHGTALKTADQGRTWQPLNLGMAYDVTAVYFATPLVGWVTYNVTDFVTHPAGYYQLQGEVRKTTDGGLTWVRYLTGEPRYANASGNFQFQSATTGYLLYGLLVPGSGAPPQGELRRTADGGQTWNRVGGVPVDGRNTRCQFLTPLLGYAVGGANVAKTTNGGQAWSYIPPETGLDCTGLWFSDPLHGWVVSRAGGATTRATMFRTLDGGTTWTPVPFSQYGPTNQPRFLGLQFADALHGTAWTLDNAVFTTDDGGSTWRLNFPGNLTDVGVRASGAGFGVGDAGTLGYTTTRGQAFARRDSTALDGYLLGNLTMNDPVRGWASAAAAYYTAKLLRTITRGTRWQELDVAALAPSVVDWSDKLSVAAAFPDQDTAFVALRTMAAPPALAGVTVLKTTDAGRTWTARPLPGGVDVAYRPTGNGFNMRFYNSRQGLLVGPRGRVWLTQDGGASWQVRSCPTTKDLRVVRWADARTAYIGGDSAAFIRSTDGGRTWQTEPAALAALGPIDNNIFTIEAPAPQLLFVNGTMRVTNGGRTWTRMTNPGSPYQVAATGTRYGLLSGLAGNQRVVRRTTDGGLNWSPIAELGNPPPTQVTISDPYNAWLYGDQGSILHYSEKFITAAPLAQTTHCAGGSLTLAFATTGTFPAAEQRFKVELSNGRGRFRPGQIRVVGQGTASPLAVALPFDVPAGSAYRLRVVQADSLVLGADTGQDLTINAAPVASLTPAGPQTLCVGRTLTLSAPAGPAQYLWSTGATTRTLTVSAGGSYTVRVAGASGCFGSPSAAAVVSVVPLPAAPVLAYAPGGPVTVVAPVAGLTYQWTLNGTLQAGVSGPRFPAAGPAPVGTFTAVAVSAIGTCLSPASAAVRVVLAVRDALPPGWALYPVPADAFLALELTPGTGPVQLTLNDALGRTVRTTMTTTTRATLDVRGLPAGIYTLRAILPNGKSMGQAVQVQH